MLESDGVILSIYVAVYNHEDYIVKALDSILMQKTQYSYEVLVGEDCSTDNTRQILKEYEKKHPGKFTIFYREKNMNKDEITNSKDLMLRCKGKYIIPLEGDDYWIDDRKLEKQISFLENHPEYYACAHKCIVVDENSNPNGEVYPECKKSEYSLWEFAKEIMPGQSTTIMCRNYYIYPGYNYSIMKKNVPPGDRRKYFMFACNSKKYGKVYCMKEIMSAYRHVTAGGSSFSANYKSVYENHKKFYLCLMEYAEEIDNYKGYVTAEMLFLLNIKCSIKAKSITLKDGLKEFKNFKYKPQVLAFLFIRDVYMKLSKFKRKLK